MDLAQRHWTFALVSLRMSLANDLLVFQKLEVREQILLSLPKVDDRAVLVLLHELFGVLSDELLVQRATEYLISLLFALLHPSHACNLIYLVTIMGKLSILTRLPSVLPLDLLGKVFVWHQRLYFRAT